MQYVFLDTNIFLHFKDFEQIDWKAVLGSDEPFIIVIAPVVMDELDTHKYHKNQKIARKVKKLLPKLEAIIEKSAPNEKVQLEYLTKQPQEEIFTANSLSLQNQDDNLLAAVLEFISTKQETDIVKLFSDDTGLRLKAKRVGIVAKGIPDEYLLANELDEVELQNRELLKELEEHRSKMPVVSLAFNNNLSLLTHQLHGPAISKKEFVDREVQKARAEHPEMYYLPAPKGEASTLFNIARAIQGPWAVTEEQVNNYNKELDKYFQEFQRTMGNHYDAYIFRWHAMKIEMFLLNTGTAPAEDIDIELHFPDGFELIDKKGFPKKKVLPSLPHRPQSALDYGFLNVGLNASRIYESDRINPQLPDPNAPTIKKTNSYNVTYRLKSLKHNQVFALAPLYAKFNNIETAKGFAIDYKLKISNLARMAEGQLHVKFEAKPHNESNT